MIPTTLSIRDAIESAGPRAVVVALAKILRYETKIPNGEEIMAAMAALAEQIPAEQELPEPGPLPF